jgi:hypothetical protein
MENNKDLSNSENILVKVDHNNLIYVDPNSVVDNDGIIQPRGLKQENLVMFVNLEADLVPRTTLIADGGQGNTLLSIAKGNFNFLKNQTGDGNYNTSWTESYNPSQPKDAKGATKDFDPNQFIDDSGQSFGIDSISISVKGANFVPQVTVNFVDVRGKTLFESAKDSPYKAFFHLPWPIFYLTVKGYYGKAIRYRLHMTKFSSKFNESNGNFEVTTTFVGSTFAYLNDIPLSAIVNCPYMYLVEKAEDKKWNESKGRYTKNINRSSRGYAILKSIYEQYESRGLVPKGTFIKGNEPVKTLKDIGYIAESLDKILEKQIFNGVVDMKVFQGIKEVGETLKDFEISIKSWSKQNLSNTDFLPKNPKTVNGEVIYENWYYYSGNKKDDTKILLGKDSNGTLEHLLDLYTTKLNSSALLINDIKKDNNKPAIDRSKVRADFKKVTLKKIKGISDYYKIIEKGFILVGIDNLISDIHEVIKTFEEQRNILEDDVEKQMNIIIKDPKQGFGFEPTIRNIFAILLANAEVYIRLMKDVHSRSFDSSKDRAKIIGSLSKENKGDAIFPWPEVRKPVSMGKQNVVAYPAEPELIEKLKSNSKVLWPEVEFVEEFMKIVTGRIDTNVKKEPTVSDIEYLFESDIDYSTINDISGVDIITDVVPYTDKTNASFVYEIYERAKYLTLFDSFNTDLLNLLAKEEKRNIETIIKDDTDLIDLVKKITSKSSLINGTKTSVIPNGTTTPEEKILFNGLLPSLSPYERFNYFRSHIPTTGYITDVVEAPFKFENNEKLGTKKSIDSEDEINNILKNYEPEKYRPNIYPFNSNTYLGYLKKNSTATPKVTGSTFTIDDLKYKGTSNTGMFHVDSTIGFIVTPSNPKSWVQSGYKDNIFSNKINNKDSTTKVSILNTPYFHKQLYSDFNKDEQYGRYAGSAYLLLNSLPFLNLDDNITFDGKTILMSSLFREISSTHFVPYHLLLKWGSIYHRYKKKILDGVDILDGFLNSSNITQPINGGLFFNLNQTNSTYLSASGATSTGTTVTVPSTTGLIVGMVVTVTSGTGSFASNTTVTSISGSTKFIVSSTPITPLSGATVTGVDNNLTTFSVTPRENTTTGTTVSVVHSGNTNVGLNPTYQSLYNQIVKGYVTYDIISGNTSYNSRTNSGYILHTKNTSSNNINYWSVIADNSKYTSTDLTYTLLPSNGYGKNNSSESFNNAEQNNFRTIWSNDDIIGDTFSGKTFASYSQYPRSIDLTNNDNDDKFSFDTNYRKVIDLIGTFSPKILDSFESMFLDFASEKSNDERPQQLFRNVPYDKFQYILKDLSVVTKQSGDDNIGIEELINNLKTRQEDGAKKITQSILDSSNIIRFTSSNPKEIDAYTFYGMANDADDLLTSYSVEPYYPSDNTVTNQNLIKLYIGEDIDVYYFSFFPTNDVRLTEDNILRYRPLVLIYAGYVKNGGLNTKVGFSNHIKDKILKSPATNGTVGADERLQIYLKTLLAEISKRDGITKQGESKLIKISQGYNTSQTKLEQYNTFKSFNDKWTSGNSIGQRLLLEEFLFLDKANRDIGDKFYLNIDKILPLLDPRNQNSNLYSAISMLIQDTGLDMRALPAYVNFYGTNVNNKSRMTPSKKVAKNLFGTFLEVDYQESSPKIIIQLVGQSSKHLADMENKTYRFSDDSFFIGSVNNNPLVVTTLEGFGTNDLSKVNKVVAFEVSFGDQNQGIFKGVSLDQATLKNTSESFVVLENLARSESGAAGYNVDVGLFDYYKQASYECTVTCMGNVMIQPTMFFYLKNIPMFRGSYWITQVSHDIGGNTISTKFTGTRIPYTSLPDPTDSFVSSYRVLFDKLMSRALAVLKQDKKPDATNEEVVTGENNITYTANRGGININNENITKGSNSNTVVGMTQFGIPYNGFNDEKLIQKIDNPSFVHEGSSTWLRTLVVKAGGDDNLLDGDTTMNIANGLKWSEINQKNKFYSTHFDLNVVRAENIRGGVTEFINPNVKNSKVYTLNPSYTFTGTMVTQGPISNGPKSNKYGMSMSASLMTELGLYPNQVIYFRIK